MTGKKLVVSENFFRTLLQSAEEVKGERRYENFIKDPPPAWRDEEGNPIDDLSSMLRYFTLYSRDVKREKSTEQDEVMRALIKVAGLNDGLEQIFFGFKINPESQSFGGKYLSAIQNYPVFGGTQMPGITKSDIRKMALGYLNDNQDKPTLLVTDEEVGRALGTLDKQVKRVYMEGV